jgi:hypothetical protein
MTTSFGLDMNRLTSRQKGSISAFQAAVLRPRQVRDSHERTCGVNKSLILTSRKAFTSDCALNGFNHALESRNNKEVKRTPRSLLTEQGFMMLLTINACDVTELRRRVIGTCGDLVVFMRIQPLRHASKMRVWILLERQEFDLVMRVIKSGLPCAEFEQPADI